MLKDKLCFEICILQHSFENARLALGGTLDLVDKVLTNQVKIEYKKNIEHNKPSGVLAWSHINYAVYW